MIYAGQKIRASTLSDMTPLTALSAVETIRTSSTVMTPIVGLSLPVEDEVMYALEAYIVYSGATGGDLKLGWTELNGADVAIGWNVNGVSTAVSSSGIGELVSVRTGNVANTAAVGCAGVAVLQACMPRGYVSTVGGAAGTLQMTMAQNTSNATATTVWYGSWIRLTKVVTAAT